MNLSWVVVLLLSVAAGCAPPNLATGQYFQDVLHPNSDEALVYFYRSSQPKAPQFPMKVFGQEDKVIGRLDDGGYFVYRTPPGRYRFALTRKPDKDDIWLDLKGGQTVFLKWGYESFTFFLPIPFSKNPEHFRFKLILVDELQGLNDLAGCRLMQAAQ